MKLKRNYYIVVGDLFEQVTNGLEVYPENEEINASRHELQVYAKTAVYLKNGSIGAHLARTAQDIYHSLNLHLDHYDKDGVLTNEIYGLEAENIDRFTAYYSDQEITHDAAGNPENINNVHRAYRTISATHF